MKVSHFLRFLSHVVASLKRKGSKSEENRVKSPTCKIKHLHIILNEIFKHYCNTHKHYKSNNWNRNFLLFFMFLFEFQYFWTFFYESKRHFSPRNIVHAPLLEITILGRSQMKPALKQTSLAPGIAAGIPHWHEVCPIGEFQAYYSRCTNSK